jgi:hypothetical protein
MPGADSCEATQVDSNILTLTSVAVFSGGHQGLERRSEVAEQAKGEVLLKRCANAISLGDDYCARVVHTLFTLGIGHFALAKYNMLLESV